MFLFSWTCLSWFPFSSITTFFKENNFSNLQFSCNWILIVPETFPLCYSILNIYTHFQIANLYSLSSFICGCSFTLNLRLHTLGGYSYFMITFPCPLFKICFFQWALSWFSYDIRSSPLCNYIHKLFHKAPMFKTSNFKGCCRYWYS